MPSPKGGNLHLSRVGYSSFPMIIVVLTRTKIDIFQFMTLNGMVNLAGGLPHPSLFPYVNLEADIYTPSASLGLDVSQDLQHVSISKFGTPEDPVDLSSSLQYCEYPRSP